MAGNTCQYWRVAANWRTEGCCKLGLVILQASHPHLSEEALSSPIECGHSLSPHRTAHWIFHLKVLLEHIASVKRRHLLHPCQPASKWIFFEIFSWKSPTPLLINPCTMMLGKGQKLTLLNPSALAVSRQVQLSQQCWRRHQDRLSFGWQAAGYKRTSVVHHIWTMHNAQCFWQKQNEQDQH